MAENPTKQEGIDGWSSRAATWDLFDFILSRVIQGALSLLLLSVPRDLPLEALSLSAGHEAGAEWNESGRPRCESCLSLTTPRVHSVKEDQRPSYFLV